MRSLLILGVTEHLLQEIEAVKPTPGYHATTAIDWENWGVTEANNFGGGIGNDATTAFSINNLFDMVGWPTEAPPIKTNDATSFDSLVATTGSSLQNIMATTEMLMPDFTTESIQTKDGTNDQTTSLLGLLGSWTTQQATTDIDLLAETTEATVIKTTVPPLPVFTTAASNDVVNATEVVTDIVTESVVSTTIDTINDATSMETNTVQLDENQAKPKNGSLLWAQLHPSSGRIDEGSNDQVSVDDTTLEDDTPDIVYVEEEEEEIVEIEIEVDQNITEVEAVEINPKIIATASTSALRPTLVLIIASLFTLIMDN